MRHKWIEGAKVGTAKCGNCGVRTSRKARPSKKPRFKGEKVGVQVYRLADGTVTEKRPPCMGNE